jgi:hypothetical protein
MAIFEFSYPEYQHDKNVIYLDATSWEEIPEALVKQRRELNAYSWYSGDTKHHVYEIADEREIDVDKLIRKEKEREDQIQKAKEHERDLKEFERLRKKLKKKLK